jgi:hypothetical protein
MGLTANRLASCLDGDYSLILKTGSERDRADCNVPYVEAVNTTARRHEQRCQRPILRLA